MDFETNYDETPPSDITQEVVDGAKAEYFAKGGKVTMLKRAHLFIPPDMSEFYAEGVGGVDPDLIAPKHGIGTHWGARGITGDNADNR